MADVRELGKRVKQRFPGQYDNIDDAELGRKVKQKFPSDPVYAQFTDVPQDDLLTRFRRNVGIAAEQGYTALKDKGAALAEIAGGIAGGDFRPALEAGESIARGAGALLMGGNPSFVTPAAANRQALAEVGARTDARRSASGDTSFSQRAEEMRQLEARAQAYDPSLSGRIVRGVTREGIKLLPTLAAGAVSGGSVPAMAAVTAASSLDEPENLALNTGLSAIPLPALRAARSVAPAAVERVLGKEAAEGLIRLTGAVADEPALRAAAAQAAPVEAAIARAVERSPWQDTVLAYYRANLLTNPVGRAADLGSTVINQFADAAARPIAAAVDVFVSKFTGARSITGPSLTGTARAIGSVRQGLRDAKEVLRTGRQAIESAGDDIVYGAEVRSGLGKLVDNPLNGVFRILGALDAPFRRFGYARNLYDRARTAAFNEVRRGKITLDQRVDRIRELLDDPDIIRAAVRDGERAVLSESNAISSWLTSLTYSRPNARLAVGLVQPFLRIPLNAVHRALDFSGLGGVKALFKIARGVRRKATGQSFFRDLEEQRVFSQNVAAGSFAPAAFILGMELEDRGKMEGYYYTSKKDYPNEKVPTSINIGGENYDINRLGGFLLAPILVGATYNRLRKQNATKANALLRSFGALVQTAPALGYYGVPAKLGRFFTSDEPADVILQELGSTASGFIPASGAAGYAAKALDPEKRRETPGFTGPIQNRIPGLRQQLPVKEEKRRRK